MPLVFLVISSVLNIVLDIWFVVGLNMSVGGAALAIVIAQAVSGFRSFDIFADKAACFKR